MIDYKKIENDSCYGCGVCAVGCPSTAITMTLSGSGFYIPFVDEEKCINCSICDKVCAMLDEKPLRKQTDAYQTKAYSVINNDKEIRRISTSGGAGFAIAETLFNSGYKLVGVKYDNQKSEAVHFVASSLDEFKQTINSKYLQSYTTEGFSDLMNGDQYAVFGTPCQIDSLYHWAKLRKKEHNFIFIDLFCHGVPSYSHWNAYLSHHLNIGEKLVKPIFRDKVNGWQNYTMTLVTNNRKLSNSVHKNDLFLNLFMGNYSLNRVCYYCKYRGESSSADLRMGDLWGRKYIKNRDGITGVLALTQRGDSVVDELKTLCSVKEEAYNTIMAGQLSHDLKVPKTRVKLLEAMKQRKILLPLYIRYAKRMWIRNIVPYEVKCFIKQLIRK